MGFEPTTSTLARLRSTPELHPHILGMCYVSNVHPKAGDGIRTHDFNLGKVALYP